MARAAILLNFFVAFGLSAICAAQSAVFRMAVGDANLLKSGVGAAFMAENGGNFLTMEHVLFFGFLPWGAWPYERL